MSEALESAIVARVQRGDVRVPAYPPSAGKLQRVLGKPGFTIDEVVKVLRTDDVLAATTLRVANSVFYSRGEPASTLSNAVVRIGSQQLHRLSVAAGTQRVFAAPGPLASLRRRAWRQSLTAAIVCECLAQAGGKPSEEAFIAGLLHDIGRVLAITVIEELGCTDEVEGWRVVERFHVELGMVIAAKWMLPTALEEVIADHHARDATETDPNLRFVQIADQVVALMEQEPLITAERLGGIGLLTTQECKALAKRIPTMPELVEAFGLDGPESSNTVSVPLTPAAANSKQVQLSAAGPGPMTAELTKASTTGLTVRASTPGRSNWLVQVKLEDVSFWANVQQSQPVASGGFEWELKPFALSAEMANRWAALTHELPAA
ncbi:MAG: HDOD domain-containing protein [Archangiaceae bacterium]|nr:HDOD domain-containing protein [Archangiaceae bacterium]